MISFEKYKEAILSGGNIPIAKVDFLHLEDESVKRTVIGEILSGNITANRSNGVRRTVSVELMNLDGEFNPDEDGDIWINYKFAISLGIRMKNDNGELEDKYFPHGVFISRSPSVVSSPSGCEITIDGIDKFSLFDGQLGGDLDAIYKIPVDSDIELAMRTILNTYVDENATVVRDPKSPIIPTIAAGMDKAPYTIVEEITSNLGAVMTHMRQVTARNMFYDVTGRFHFENNIPDIEKGAEWDFKDTNSMYLGSSMTYNFEGVINKVVVVGANVNGSLAKASAVNTNQRSSTCIQKIGIKLRTYSVPAIKTDAQALEYAKYLLRYLSVLQSSVSLTCVPVYHLNVDDIVTITDKNHEIDEKRFVVLSYSIPFDGSAMTMEVIDTDELVTV